MQLDGPRGEITVVGRRGTVPAAEKFGPTLLGTTILMSIQGSITSLPDSGVWRGPGLLSLTQPARTLVDTGLLAKVSVARSPYGPCSRGLGSTFGEVVLSAFGRLEIHREARSIRIEN